MTKEEFIKRVEERYGKRFTFEKTVYKNYKKCKENNIILKYFTLEKFLNENYIDRLYSDVGELLKI